MEGTNQFGPFIAAVLFQVARGGGGVEIVSNYGNITKRDNTEYVWKPCPGRCFSDYKQGHEYSGNAIRPRRTFAMCNSHKPGGLGHKERALENCCEECAMEDQGLEKPCLHFTLGYIEDTVSGCARYYCQIFKEPRRVNNLNEPSKMGGVMLNVEAYAPNGTRRKIEVLTTTMNFSNTVRLIETSSWPIKFYNGTHNDVQFIPPYQTKRINLIGNESTTTDGCWEYPPCYGMHRGYKKDFGDGWFKIILEIEGSTTESERISRWGPWDYKFALNISSCGEKAFYAKSYIPFNRTRGQYKREFDLWFHIKEGLPTAYNYQWQDPQNLSHTLYGYSFFDAVRNMYLQTIPLTDEWRKPPLTVSFYERYQLRTNVAFRHYDPDGVRMKARLQRNLLVWSLFDFQDGVTATTEWDDDAKDDFRIAINDYMPPALYEEGFLAKANSDTALSIALGSKSKTFRWFVQRLQGEHLSPEHRVVVMKLAEDNNGFNGLPAKLEIMDPSFNGHIHFNGHARLTWDPEKNGEEEREKSVMLFEMYMYYVLPLSAADAKDIVDAAKAVFRNLIFDNE